jgi:hypothetical protein
VPRIAKTVVPIVAIQRVLGFCIVGQSMAMEWGCQIMGSSGSDSCSVAAIGSPDESVWSAGLVAGAARLLQ